MIYQLWFLFYRLRDYPLHWLYCRWLDLRIALLFAHNVRRHGWAATLETLQGSI